MLFRSFTINEQQNDGIFREEILNEMKAEYESEYLRVVKFNSELDIKINGMKSIGVVQKTNEK